MVDNECSTYQHRVHGWFIACLGNEVAMDKLQRADRFVEEAMELVQAVGYDAARAHALVDYVFSRPVGEAKQEVGGVSVTLAALCTAADIWLIDAAEDELARAWTIMDRVRQKNATATPGSPLPGFVAEENDCPGEHQEVLDAIEACNTGEDA